MPGKDLDWSSNCVDKVFDRTGHGGLVCGSRNLELLPKFLHIEDHCFGLIGHRCSEEGNGLNDIADDSF